MKFADFIVEGAQTGYEKSLIEIANKWISLIGGDRVNSLIGSDFPERVADLLEIEGIEDSVRINLASDMKMISWWRRPLPSIDARRRIDISGRCALESISAAYAVPSIPLQKSKLRRSHVIFAGTLMSVSHSPSAGAVDYAAALAMSPQVQSLYLIHHGDILPDMEKYIKERLGYKIARGIINIVSSKDNPGFFRNIVDRGGCTFHNWCEPPYSIYTSVASRMGPIITFACADEVPIQYADVFWYFHSNEYIHQHWQEKGAPEHFIENYHRCASGPCLDGPPPESITRVSIGLREDAFVIATVGNRLAVEMDETFLTGMVAKVRSNPNCVWMVVGGLPDELVLRLSEQLGAQFVYGRFEPQLAKLMTIVDVFANPFRSGGGNSVNLALGAGAATLTLGKGDVATLVPSEFHAISAEDFFRKLEDLIHSPETLATWKSKQFDHNRTMRDQTAFSASLKQMIDIAGSRYNDRIVIHSAA